MENYPLYYRQRGRCIKLTSATTGIEVRVPEEGKPRPFFFTDLAELGITTEEQIKEIVSGMTPCDQSQYESYVATYYQLNHSNRMLFNNYRQKRYDNGTLKL